MIKMVALREVRNGQTITFGDHGRHLYRHVKIAAPPGMSPLLLVSSWWGLGRKRYASRHLIVGVYR